VTGVPPIAQMTPWCIIELAGRRQLPQMRWPQEHGLVGSFQGDVERCCEFDPAERPHISEVHALFSAWLCSAGVPCFAGAGSGETQDLAGAAQSLQQKVAEGVRVRGAGSRRHRAATSSEGAPGEPPAAGAQPVAGAAFMKLPEFGPTPLRTQLAMLLEVTQHWNFAVPQTSCCLFHAEVSQIQLCCEKLAPAKCKQPSTGPAVGQCEVCGALLQSTDVCEDGATQCSNCGEAVDIPGQRRRPARAVEGI